MKFVLGRSDVSVTIFVPWDCTFNCPFCTSKKMYSTLKKDTLEERMDSILNLIRKFNNTSIPNFVITGGEPLNNLPNLKRIVDTISPNKKIYINTSLPYKGSAEAIKYLNSEKKITSISISRHNAFKENDSPLLSPDLILETIRNTLPIRLNCVIMDPKHFPVNTYIDRYKEIDLPQKSTINFRADYTKIKNLNELKSFDDPFLYNLINSGCDYKGSNGCNVCNNDFFEKDGMRIAYHRGFQYTRQRLSNTMIVNDIIIFPDATWGYDWDKYAEEKNSLLRSLHINEIKERPKNYSLNEESLVSLMKKYLNDFNFEKNNTSHIELNTFTKSHNNFNRSTFSSCNESDDEYEWIPPDTVCGFPERVKKKKQPPKKVRVIYPACGAPYEEEIKEDSGWGNSCGGGFGSMC